MQIQDLIQLFRRQVGDVNAPYLWDDDEVLQFVIDAQDRLVRHIGGISDYTGDLCELTVEEDEPFSSFSPYILRIVTARMLGTKTDIKIISEPEFNNIQVVDYGIINPVFLDDEDTGVVTHGIIGLEDYKIRWYRVPDADDTCRLHMYRLPYPRIEEQEDTLEVDEQHHYHLVKWMKHLAYSKEDSETYDKSLAESNERMFEKYCETAKSEKERQRYKPRFTKYGGL